MAPAAPMPPRGAYGADPDRAEKVVAVVDADVAGQPPSALISQTPARPRTRSVR